MNKKAIPGKLYVASENLHSTIIKSGEYGKYIVIILQEKNDTLCAKRISPDEIRWPVMCFGEQKLYLNLGSSDLTDRYYFYPQSTVATIKKCCIRYSNGEQTFWMIKHHLWMLKQLTMPTNENHHT